MIKRTKKAKAKAKVGRRAAERAFDKQVGARIKEKRVAAGMKATQVGIDLGISESQVFRYESGATTASPALLAQFAKMFGCKVCDFVDGIRVG